MLRKQNLQDQKRNKPRKNKFNFNNIWIKKVVQTNYKIQISNLEIIFIDDDGFAIGHIINKNRPDQEIEIPLNKKNIDFDIGDHLLVELEFVGKKQ